MRGFWIEILLQHFAFSLHATQHLPGTLFLEETHLLVACTNQTAIFIEELQLEGKRRMPAEEFLRGFQIKEGEQLQ